MSEFFTRERRNRNMKKVLEALETTKLDFNSLMFTMIDIVQSTFINGALVGVSPEEKQKFFDTVIEQANAFVPVLNERKNSQMVDIVSLTNLLMDVLESATQQAIQSRQVDDSIKHT